MSITFVFGGLEFRTTLRAVLNRTNCQPMGLPSPMGFEVDKIWEADIIVPNQDSNVFFVFPKVPNADLCREFSRKLGLMNQHARHIAAIVPIQNAPAERSGGNGKFHTWRTFDYFCHLRRQATSPVVLRAAHLGFQYHAGRQRPLPVDLDVRSHD